MRLTFIHLIMHQMCAKRDLIYGRKWKELALLILSHGFVFKTLIKFYIIGRRLEDVWWTSLFKCFSWLLECIFLDWCWIQSVRIHTVSNIEWRLMFHEAEAEGLPAIGSGHSPVLLSLYAGPVKRRKEFKFGPF